MDKKKVLTSILEKLTDDLNTYFRAARLARFEATDSENKAENKYDTRGIEASYLAHGQSRQAIQTKNDFDAYEAMLHHLDADVPHDSIRKGTLVTLEFNGEQTFYFIGPAAGGLEVNVDGEEITVMTPDSPLGASLLDKKAGDSVRIQLPGGSNIYQITQVS